MSQPLDPSFPFEISGPDAGPADTASPWSVEPAPSTFIIFTPGESPPDAVAVESALAAGSNADVKILDRPDPPDADVRWAFVADVADVDQPMIVWCEPAEPLPPDAPAPDAVRTCRWTVGVQTMLVGDDLIGHFGRLLGVLTRGFANAPAILDTGANRMHDRAALDDLFRDPSIEPPAAAMWLLHCVPDQSGDVLWLFTDGLHRCGRPELEMLDVPAAHRDTAARIMNRIAGRIIEEQAPTPGSMLEIGPNLVVSLQQAGEVAKYLHDATPGSPATRSGEEAAMLTRRAAVCGHKPTGQYAAVWQWPREAIEAIERGETTLYMTERATARQQARARATWSRLLDAYRRLTGTAAGPLVEFYVKVAFGPTSDERNASEARTAQSPREHAWLHVRDADEHSVTGEITHELQHVGGPTPGETVTINLSDITDWVVSAPDGDFGPGQPEHLQAAISRLEQASGASSAR